MAASGSGKSVIIEVWQIGGGGSGVSCLSVSALKSEK